MSQPKIKFELNSTDKMLDILVLLGLIVLFAVPFYYYGNLPNEIPTHFNAAGKPDAYGNKTEIWLMPIIGLLLAMGMYYLNRLPHLFNYPVTITEENAAIQYSKATKLMRVINLIIVISFAYINYSTIQTAFGNANGLGNGFIILLLVGMFGAIFYYLFSSSKAK